MNHFSKDDDVLVKSLTLRVFAIGNASSTKRVLHAGRGKGYSFKAVREILESVAVDLYKRFPREEFVLVKVGPSNWNFVHRGKRVEPLTL